LMPYLGEAMKLYEEGVDKQVIDKSAEAFGMPMGPIALADKVGLDVCMHVAENLCQHYGGEVSSTLQEMVNSGKLGVKSGEGFYKYDKKGKPVKSSQSAQSRSDDVTDRMILMMLNEAVACLQEGVVTSEELLDAGMIFGTGFAPFRGGPLQYACDRGVKSIVETLNTFAKQYGERFAPSDGWGLLLDDEGHVVPDSNNEPVSQEQEEPLTHV